MTTLKKGSKGEEVKALQKRLNLLEDGIYGPLTEEAVKDFQRENGLTADGITGPKTWEALGIIASPRTVANPRKITKIIVHCAATPEGKDYTVDEIRGWHLKRGFNDIGYHWVIYRDGSIHKGRDERLSGAHTAGQNSCSVGICYIGGITNDGKKTPKDTRTPAQKEAMLNLLTELKRRYPGAKIYSHRDFAKKACPSFDATREYANLW